MTKYFRWLVWVRPFWEWLCNYPVLLAEALLVMLMVWGFLGRDLGVPALFWHQDGLTQFLAGLGVGLLLGKLCFIGYLLDADEAWMQKHAPRFPKLESLVRAVPGTLWWYLLVTWPVLLLILAARMLVPVGGDDVFATTFDPAEEWLFVVGLGVAPPLAIAGFLLLLHLLGDLLLERLKRFPDFAELPPERIRLHVMAVLIFGIALVAYLALALSPARGWVTPAIALCLVLDLVAALYGFLLFHFPRWVYPLLALAVAWAGLVNSGDKQTLPTLEPYYDEATRQPLDQYRSDLPRAKCGLLDSKSALDQWLAQYRRRHGAEGRPQLVVVCASGGGSRSALWTATVLAEMERLKPGSLSDVRLIAGASGGMLGASYVIARLDELRAIADPAQRQQFLESLLDDLECDHLTPVVQSLVLHDLPILAWPGRTDMDRGRALEDAWHAHLHGKLDIPVRQLQAGEAAGWRPSLAFSPMLIEDGRRLLVSNLDLAALTRSSGFLGAAPRPDEQLYSTSALEFFRLFPQATDFKLSTAVRMSASFPYISPAVALPTRPLRRVVDAGYYDNFGVNLAGGWLYEHRQWIRDHDCRVVLMQLRDGQSSDSDRDVQQPSEAVASLWARASEWLMAPAHGVLHARGATMAFRNNEQVGMLSDVFGKDRFTTVMIECKPKAAMSWYLSEEESTLIRISVKDEAEVGRLAATDTALARRLTRLQAKEAPRAQEAKAIGVKNKQKLQVIQQPAPR